MWKMFSCFSNYQRFLFITLKVSVLIDRVLLKVCCVKAAVWPLQGQGSQWMSLHTLSFCKRLFFFVANFTDTINRVWTDCCWCGSRLSHRERVWWSLVLTFSAFKRRNSHIVDSLLSAWDRPGDRLFRNSKVRVGNSCSGNFVMNRSHGWNAAPWRWKV